MLSLFAHASCANGLSPLIPYTSQFNPVYSRNPLPTLHISSVHVPVNAIGKNNSSVFFFPKLSLNLICLGPSAVLVGKLKSGALVPTAIGINGSSSLGLTWGDFHYRNRGGWVKAFVRARSARPVMVSNAKHL